MSYASALGRISELEANLGEGYTGTYPGAGENGFGQTLQTAIDRFSNGPTLLNVPASNASANVSNDKDTPNSLSPSTGALGNSGVNGYSTVSAIGSSTIPAGSGLSQELNATFDAAAGKYGVSPDLVKAIGKVESGYNASAVSPAGAQGIMQLMPSTAKGLGVSDPFDAAQNIDGGTKYIAGLLKRFNGNVTDAVAAYNAGPNAVAKYGGVPPYTETKNYVDKVLSYASQFAASDGSASTFSTADNPLLGTDIGALTGGSE